LLTGVFGCTNPPSDYASGQDLFGERAWPWLVAAGRHNFALVEPGRVTIVWPTAYEIRAGSYRLIPDATLPRERLPAAPHDKPRPGAPPQAVARGAGGDAPPVPPGGNALAPGAGLPLVSRPRRTRRG